METVLINLPATGDILSFHLHLSIYHSSNADSFFVDVDYTGNYYVICFNSITEYYMACGITLMNYQNGESIGKALSVFSAHIKQTFPRYNTATLHKEILSLDFDEGEANAFQQSIGMEIAWLFCIFYKICYENSKDGESIDTLIRISNFHVCCKINSSKDKVKLAFNVLSGSEPFTKLSESLPPPLCNSSLGEVDTVRWSRVQTWTDWRTRPAILQKLKKAFSSINAGMHSRGIYNSFNLFNVVHYSSLFQ